MGFHMLTGLLKDTHILHPLLTKGVGLFEVLSVNLCDGLLVVSLGNLPSYAASEFTIKGVHVDENLFEVSRFVLTRLVIKKQAEARKVRGALRNENL